MGQTTADVAARSLYLYVNRAEDRDPADVAARALYTYVNRQTWGHPVGGEPLGPDDVLARNLYLYVSRAHDRTKDDVAARTLYTYVAYTNDEPFPWIERIRPTEQYPGGQVEIYGDGFGDSEAAEGSSVRLGVYDPDVPGPGLLLGVVTWSARSPNLWPANGDGSGANPPRSLPAIVVTVPPEAVSGMLSVEETI
jgi:hypothetical protein